MDKHSKNFKKTTTDGAWQIFDKKNADKRHEATDAMSNLENKNIEDKKPGKRAMKDWDKANQERKSKVQCNEAELRKIVKEMVTKKLMRESNRLNENNAQEDLIGAIKGGINGFKNGWNNNSKPVTKQQPTPSPENTLSFTDSCESNNTVEFDQQMQNMESSWDKYIQGYCQKYNKYIGSINTESFQGGIETDIELRGSYAQDLNIMALTKELKPIMEKFPSQCNVGGKWSVTYHSGIKQRMRGSTLTLKSNNRNGLVIVVLIH